MKKEKEKEKNIPWYSLLCSHLRYRCRRRLQREYRSSKNGDGEGKRNIPFWLVDLVYRYIGIASLVDPDEVLGTTCDDG